MSQRLDGVRPRLTWLAIMLVVTNQGSPLTAQSAGGGGKIPISTASADAKQLYLKGRTLAENLRAQDSREFLTQAAAKDPGRPWPVTVWRSPHRPPRTSFST
jgi:hypothetical protein